jgi:hypothetical protein
MSAQPTPAQRYLRLVRKHMAAIRRDLPRLVDMGERMAEPLLGGGNLFAPSVAGWWCSEFGGRAGGLMGIKWSNYVPRSGKDVAFFALPDPRRWNAAEDKTLAGLVESKAQLFVIGRQEDLGDSEARHGCKQRSHGTRIRGHGTRFAAFTGGCPPEEGFYGTDQVRPLATMRQFEQLVRAWIVTGEMIATCTRGGKMPTIWMSVWLEGSLVRNAGLTRHDNLREPWFVPLFHENLYIPPLAPGHVGGEFLGILDGIIDRLAGQTGALAQAGAWLAQAKRAGRRGFVVAVGHSYPAILERSGEKDYPLEWGRSISDLSKAFPADLAAGDVALHLGYAPIDLEALDRVLRKGFRLIHTSPYGRRAGMKDRGNFLWFDLPWRPADQSVDVPGYAVRILPMSSSAQTVAYNAILCEMAERLGWR